MAAALAGMPFICAIAPSELNWFGGCGAFGISDIDQEVLRSTLDEVKGELIC